MEPRDTRRTIVVLMGTRDAIAYVKHVIRQEETKRRYKMCFHLVSSTPSPHFCENLRVLEESHMRVVILFCIDYFVFNGTRLNAYLDTLQLHDITPDKTLSCYPSTLLFTECLTSSTNTQMCHKLQCMRDAKSRVHSRWLDSLIAASESALLLGMNMKHKATRVEQLVQAQRRLLAPDYTKEQVWMEIQSAAVDDEQKGCYLSITVKRSRPHSTIVFSMLPSGATRIVNRVDTGVYHHDDDAAKSVSFMQETRVIYSTDREVRFWITEDDSLILSLNVSLGL